MKAPLDRGRLAAVLGMLGSDAAGERAAAGLLASRILGSAGMPWRELLGVETPEPRGRVPHGDALAVCRRHADKLTAWERAFVDSLGRQRRPFTPRQRTFLAEIATRVAQPQAGAEAAP